ncbi:hypothetical protein [Consotaella aegiceratis]|uniref:hypothetical protein n=1 Tax=Consotaella aegiceratis TaxID=3097961 RepID=UPI002F4040D8
MTSTILLRLPLLAITAGALVLGLDGGLARLGLAPAPMAALDLHGAVMICGFFGTLIAVERAVADGRTPAFLVPALAALGAVLLIAGQERPAAAAFLSAGLGLTLLTGLAAFKLRTLFAAIMTAGAALWAWGCGLWIAGAFVMDVSYLWLGFLILTIVGERVELSRLISVGTGAKGLLVLLVALFVKALGRGEPWNGVGLLAPSMAGMAFWLFVHDIALKTVTTSGLARYSAVCLLAGYAWLAAAAVSMAVAPPGVAAFGHDAVVHAIGLGFVLSMVFAHAPIILPAVTGIAVRYLPALYAPAILLHTAVALRIIGDLSERIALLSLSAWLTIASIILYVGTLVASAGRTVCRKHPIA